MQVVARIVPLWVRQNALLVAIYVIVMSVLAYWVGGWHDVDMKTLQLAGANMQPMSDDVSLVYVRGWDGEDVALNRRILARFIETELGPNQPAAIALDFDFGPCQSHPCGKALTTSTDSLVRSLKDAKRRGVSIYAVDLFNVDERDDRVVTNGSGAGSPLQAQEPRIYAALSGAGHTNFLHVDTPRWDVLERIWPGLARSVSIDYYRRCFNAGGGGLPHDEWNLALLAAAKAGDAASVLRSACDDNEAVLWKGSPLSARAANVHYIAASRPVPVGADLAGKRVVVGWEQDRPAYADRRGPELLAWTISNEISGQMPELRPQNGTLRFSVPAFSLLTALAFAAWFLLLKRLRMRGLRPLLPELASGLALLIGMLVFGAFELSRAFQPQVALTACGVLVSAVLCDVRGRQILFRERWQRPGEGEQKVGYDVFISYAHEERDWVRTRVLSPLQAARLPDGRKLSIFFDESSIRVGDGWKDEFCDAIDAARFIVVIYSEIYKTKSYCLYELNRAHDKWIEHLKDGAQSHCVLPIMRGRPTILPTFRDFQYTSIDDDPDVVEEVIEEIVTTLSTEAERMNASAVP